MDFSRISGLTPKSMKMYRELRKRRLKVSLKKLDVTKIKEVVKEWNDFQREQRRQARLKFLTEQARHFEPYIPKITKANSKITKQSSVSVLQSFTSAVQQLCSPEKNGPSATATSKKSVQCVDLCSSDSDEN